MAAKIRIGILGTCPVCEGEFKVQRGSLVHHGFTRPGDGMIHGDCFAVGYEPYERSTKGCEDYKAVIVQRRASLKKFLPEIPTRTYWSEIHPTRAGRVEVVEYAIGVTDAYTWRTFVEQKTRSTEYEIRKCGEEITRMDKRIAAWTLKPLREVTEEAAQAVLKAEREARKAEREAKNAEKNAKAAALKAKREEKAAKREAAFVKFLETLKAFDSSPESESSKVQAARAAWHQFFSKKNERELGGSLGDLYYEFKKRGVEDLLVRVGLAVNVPGPVSYVRYFYSTYSR